MNRWNSEIQKKLLIEITALFIDHSFDSSKAMLKLSSTKHFKQYPPELLREGLDIVESRVIAKKRGMGDWVEEGLFLKHTLQQATHPIIAGHHAQAFAGRSHLVEICGGLAFDTAALSREVSSITMYEADPTIAAFAAHNLALQGISNVQIYSQPFEGWNTHSQVFDAVWADPSRRTKNGARISNPEEYSPSLSSVLGFGDTVLCGVKVSPLLGDFTLSGQKNNFSREFIGFQGECKEQILWFNGTEGQQFRKVTFLSDKGSDDSSNFSAPMSFNTEPEFLEINESFNWQLKEYSLVEPHPALAASGLIRPLYAKHGVKLFDKVTDFGIVERGEGGDIPGCLLYAIVGQLPFDLKKISAELIRRGWGKNTILKKRNFALEPESLRKKLTFGEGKDQGILIFTRIGKKEVAFLCGQQ